MKKSEKKSKQDIKPLLSLKNISKSFPGVQALDNVSFECRKGEVMALVGENGAGKSTLMKIIMGVYSPDVGEIKFQGKNIHFSGPKEAQEFGISIIYQESETLPYLNVAENIFLGREPTDKFGVIKYFDLYQRSRELLHGLNLTLDPTTLVHKLRTADRKLIEIARALSLEAKLIIMDEPSAPLSSQELENLFDIIKSLKQEGVTIVYISHRLEEIFEISDRVTVLRDGQVVRVGNTCDMDEPTLIRLMVGRAMEEKFPEKKHVVDKTKGLVVKNLSCDDLLQDINFQAFSGEILGVAGLVGAGRSELAKAIFGAIPKTTGEIFLNGEKILIRSPKDGLREGIGLVTEDRKDEGLILSMSVRHNITLTILDWLSRLLFINQGQENKVVNDIVGELEIKTPSIEHEIRFLSGGNQQKVALAKWLIAKTKVIILDEPTKGIDVGTKFEIYKLMNELAESGKIVILISSELPEILGVSDRILVMHNGRITGELEQSEANQEKILALAMGSRNNEESE